ncbi:protein of unknown function [Streptomyces murinus]
MLDRGPGRAAAAGTAGIVRRLLGTAGGPLGVGRTPDDLPGAGRGRFGRGVGVAVRGPHRDPTSPAAGGTLHGVSHPRRHQDHVDDPTNALPATRSPPRRRTSHVCVRLRAPLDRVSYNFLYGFKAACSAPRARPGPRPGWRSCLRPAPPRSSPADAMPCVQQSAA